MLFFIVISLNSRIEEEEKMSNDAFQRCFQELMKGEDFSRISFLRLMAEICSVEEHKQIYLSFYAFYHLMYVENRKSCLLAIEKGLHIHEETLPASLLLAIKAAILTHISKHTQALQSFKEAIQVVHQINQKKSAVHPHYKKIFPNFLAKIIELINLSRGRREFLVLLDQIKGQIQDKPGFSALQSTVNSRMGQIRESMRCVGKAEHQKKLLMSSSSMGVLSSSKHEPEPESTTSIYINRLYQQRRKNLGLRDQSSGFKKTTTNPYQLNLHQPKTQGSDCYLM